MEGAGDGDKGRDASNIHVGSVHHADYHGLNAKARGAWLQAQVAVADARNSLSHMTLSSDKPVESPQKSVPFVVLRHEQRDGVHFDVMIQHGDALATWKCAAPPEQGGPLACERIGDHRLAYLTYEGPISGDRGSVTRHDAGTCDVIAWEAARVEVVFRGTRLVGTVVFTRRAAGDQSWTLERVGG